MRKKLATYVRLLLLLMAVCLMAPAPAQSPIGTWATDQRQLPVFRYTGKIPYACTTADGQKINLPADPWFLLGNYKLTGFVYTSGTYELYSFDRAWGKLNQSQHTKAVCVVNKIQYNLTGLDSPIACTARKEFGTGFARFTYTLPGGISIVRTLSVAPSASINTGLSAVFIHVDIKNNGPKPVAVDYTEQVAASYVQLQRSPWVRYTARGHMPQAGLSTVRFTPRSAYGQAVGRETASLIDYYPPLLYQYTNQPCHYAQYAADSTTVRSEATFRRDIDAGVSATVQLTTGWAYDANVSQVLVATRQQWAHLDTEPTFRDQWAKKLPAFVAEKDSILKREMIWNAYTLEAMAKYNAYFGETVIPQGMNYDFQWGLTASSRDLLFLSLPTAHYNPALAKSIIRFVAKMMRPSGQFDYLLRGFGYADMLGMNPSDLQLDFFWAVASYIKTTGDYGILTEQTDFYPKGAGRATVLAKLERGFVYLRDDIGVGPHGLIRVLNADWNDQVWANYNMREYYGRAESHYNSALALYTMTGLSEVLTKLPPSFPADERANVGRLTKNMGMLRAKQLTAFMTDLGDRVFPRRIYYSDTLAWGNTFMHAESVAMTLLVPELSAARKQRLVDASWQRLVAGEVLGPRLSDQPIGDKVIAKGNRENAGVWPFTSSLMALGYAQVDTDKAWALLRMTSFHNFSTRYPTYWAGQWTNLDATNSSLAAYPGLPDNPGGMWNSFPAYCANIHAMPLFVYYTLTTAP